VGLRAGLDDMEKIKFLPLLGLELQPLGRPARSQSLYRLRYPGSIARPRAYKMKNGMMIMYCALKDMWSKVVVRCEVVKALALKT
jgi:hypothetical protein